MYLYPSVILEGSGNNGGRGGCLTPNLVVSWDGGRGEGVWHQTLLPVGEGDIWHQTLLSVEGGWGGGRSDTKLCCLGSGVWHQTFLSVGWAGVWHQTLLSVMNDVVCFMPIQSKVNITARTLVGWYVFSWGFWEDFFVLLIATPPPPPPPHTHTHMPVPPLVTISKTKMRYG